MFEVGGYLCGFECGIGLEILCVFILIEIFFEWVGGVLVMKI